jgi:hypothetical protein
MLSYSCTWSSREQIACATFGFDEILRLQKAFNFCAVAFACFGMLAWQKNEQTEAAHSGDFFFDVFCYGAVFV